MQADAENVTLSFVPSDHVDIAVVGAGIGGLALTLALQQLGRGATVFEWAGLLTEVGAEASVGLRQASAALRKGSIARQEANVALREASFALGERSLALGVAYLALREG